MRLLTFRGWLILVISALSTGAIIASLHALTGGR